MSDEIVLAMPGVDEPWYDAHDHGHSVPAAKWAEYVQLLTQVAELEDEMYEMPYVDHRPPMSEEARRMIQTLFPRMFGDLTSGGVKTIAGQIQISRQLLDDTSI